MSREGSGYKLFGVRMDGPRIGFLIFDALLLCFILWLLLADFSVTKVNYTAWIYPGDHIVIEPTDDLTVQLGAMKELHDYPFAGGQWQIQKPINLGRWPWELQWAYISEPFILKAPINTTVRGSEIVLLHVESDKEFVVDHTQERYGWMRNFVLILFALMQLVFWFIFRLVDSERDKTLQSAPMTVQK